jgi:hypothetical protein
VRGIEERFSGKICEVGDFRFCAIYTSSVGQCKTALISSSAWALVQFQKRWNRLNVTYRTIITSILHIYASARLIQFSRMPENTLSMVDHGHSAIRFNWSDEIINCNCTRRCKGSTTSPHTFQQLPPCYRIQFLRICHPSHLSEFHRRQMLSTIRKHTCIHANLLLYSQHEPYANIQPRS